jgi:hypothetical protein
MDMQQVVFMVMVIILLLVGLYYLYKMLYTGSTKEDDVVVFGPTSEDNTLDAYSNKPTIVSGSRVPQIYPGGEYSVSAWIYIDDWSVNKGPKNKPFLTLSGGTGQYKTMVMYLGQYTNKLGVRVSYDAMDPTDSLSTINDTQYSAIVEGKSPFSDSAPDFKMCDIESIDLQKWVNITAVMIGRTVDIYIDGKLSRSCVLPGGFKVDGDTPTITLGGPTGFGGKIGQVMAANIAYSPDTVYSYYQNGPFSAMSLRTLNPFTYSIRLMSNGMVVFDTQGDTKGIVGA